MLRLQYMYISAAHSAHACTYAVVVVAANARCGVRAPCLSSSLQSLQGQYSTHQPLQWEVETREITSGVSVHILHPQEGGGGRGRRRGGGRGRVEEEEGGLCGHWGLTIQEREEQGVPPQLFAEWVYD